MKSNPMIFILCFFIFTAQLLAQDINQDIPKYDKISLGLGIGQVFGGIGGNLLVYPQNNFGIFGGLGYAIAGVGYNVGVKIRFVSQKIEHTIQPYITGMYGYNTIVFVIDNSALNKMFYGPTIGFGVDYKLNPSKKSYWTTAILVPLRSSEVKDYTYTNNLDLTQLPFSITLGCHIMLK
jgi:hypothetical protein